jgi:hypothetical protein
MTDDLTARPAPLLSERSSVGNELYYHQARVLLLLNAFSANRGYAMRGLTKLAKLDFLLRYPNFLERLLPGGADDWPLDTRPTPNEYLAVESQVIRYKYGPWDDRYHLILSALVGRGLITYTRDRSGAAFRVSRKGRQLASEIAAEPSWHITAARCAMLRKHLNYNGNHLKQVIYANLPELVDRTWRTEV